MKSVSSIVEEIISRKPFLQEALSKGIINYGSLADMIMPDVESSLKKKVKHAAVMMSLRRLNQKLAGKPMSRIKFDEDSNLLVREGLIEMTVEKSSSTLKKIRSLFDKVDYGKGDFLTITQGVYEITFIANRKNQKMLERTFEKDQIVNVMTDLSALTLTIPLGFIDTPGFYYIVTKALAWENINVDEIVSTARELTLIVNSKDVPYAFTVLKELISSS